MVRYLAIVSFLALGQGSVLFSAQSQPQPVPIEKQAPADKKEEGGLWAKIKSLFTGSPTKVDSKPTDPKERAPLGEGASNKNPSKPNVGAVKNMPQPVPAPLDNNKSSDQQAAPLKLGAGEPKGEPKPPAGGDNKQPSNPLPPLDVKPKQNPVGS